MKILMKQWWGILFLLLVQANIYSQPSPPTLSSPANGSTSISTSPTLSWGAVAAADSFRVQIATDAGFTSVIADVGGITATSYSASGLSYYTDYYWHVYAKNGFGASAYSSTFTFKTILNTPSLSSPSNGATNILIPISLTWSGVTGATGYRIQIARDVSFSVIVKDTTNGGAASYNFNSSIQFNTQYFWRIRATDGTDYSSYSSTYDFTTVGPPAPPTLYYPIDRDSLVKDTPAMKWGQTSPLAADSFTVQITPDPTFYYVQYSSNVIGDTVHIVQTALHRGSIYYWRVRAMNEAGVGIYSSKDTFRVAASGDSMPPVPQLTYPINGFNVQSTNVTLYWYPLWSIDSCTFQVELRTTNSFTGTPTDSNITALLFNYPSLTSNTVYYWKVRTKRFGIYSVWSSADSFRTTALTDTIKPNLAWPIGGAMIYTSSVNLHWWCNGPISGITFDIQVDSISTAFTSPQSFTGVSGTDQVLNVYGVGTKYYWRVRSYNGSINSSWSAIDSFVTEGYSGSAVPILNYPTGGVYIYALSTPLNWHLNAFQVGYTYDLQYATNSLFTGATTVSGLTSTTYSFSGLSWGVTYYWRVRSNGSFGTSAWSAGESFTVTGTGGSSVPVLNWPIGGTTLYGTSQTLYWHLNGAIAGLTFEVEYNTNNSFIGVPNVTGLTSTQYALTGLTEGLTYYWRVRSNNGTFTNSWSSSESFVIYQPAGPSRPLIGTPKDNITVNSNSPTFSWFINTLNPPDVKYDLEIADNINFTNSSNISNILITHFAVNGLNKGKKYFWRVKGKTNNGKVSPYSNIASFNYGNPLGAENEITIPKEFALKQNFPNPFNPSTIINFDIPENLLVSLKVFDLLGREVKTLLNDNLAAGSYSVEWLGVNNFGQKLSSGTYIIRITAGNFVQSKKMILMK